MKTVSTGGRIKAVLGPTNTGKTRFAIERMLAHRTGVIGLPLRLLAREVYDKVRVQRGPSSVALLTGEERIIPERAKYWVCTVEAMPVANGADFMCVDEIQLCGDRERGHVFTDRLLRARGQVETMFLGSDTMRPVISRLVDGTLFEHRERLSSLSHTGSRKISRMRPRSALVAFSVEEVYAIAEIVRRQRGGAAVVMGALSPRTRNAQVELYQNGDVDFLVATDAIGMGLNLKIEHVAFVGLTKFDGNKIRRLAPNEIAQIAGRAGRYKTPGTFGTTADAGPMDPEAVAAIEENRFRNLTSLQWRSSDLDFRSADTLLASLRQDSGNPMLARAQEAEDVAALRELSEIPDVRQRLSSPQDVRLLWGVCQIPNFIGTSIDDHAGMIRTVFNFVRDSGYIPDDWLEKQVRQIDRIDGEVDTLARRIAGIRNWTYVSHRPDWVENSSYWQERTRAVEDRISDALHAGLTKRFVDRRTSVLLKHMKQKEKLVTTVNAEGEVEVEGEHVGRLVGFRFIQAAASTPEEERAVKAASLKVLAPELLLRANRLYNAPNTEFDLTEQGGLMWGEHSVGKLLQGKAPLEPEIEVFVDEHACEEAREKVSRRLKAFVGQKIASGCEALQQLAADEEITGLARGVAYRIVESLGVIERTAIAGDVKELDQDNRKLLRRHGVRFGQRTIYVQPVLRPEATRWRIVLWSLSRGLPVFPPPPPPGLVTIPANPEAPDGYYPLSGYDAVGNLAIRIDMLERLLNLLRAEDGRAGFEATADMLSITGLSLERFAELMNGLGYRADRFERQKERAPLEAREEGREPVPGEAAAVEVPVEGGTQAVENATAEGDAAAVQELDPVAEATDEPAPPAPEAEAGIQAETASGEAKAAELPVEGGTHAVEGATAEGDAAAAQQLVPAADAADESTSHAPEVGAGTHAEADSVPQEPEMVVAYRFTWQPKRRQRQGRREAAGPEGRRSAPGRQKSRPQRKRKETARAAGKAESNLPRQERKERPVDPDNPFSVLMELKEKL